MAPPTQRQDPPIPWRTALSRAAIIIGIVGAIAWYYAQNPQFLTGSDVILEIDAPGRVTPLIDGALPMEVKLTLTNLTKKQVELVTSNPCKVFRWLILTAGGDFVQSKRTEEDCPAVTLNAMLEPNGTATEQFRIDLDPARVQPGDYTLRVAYWGYEAEKSFRVMPKE